MLRFRRTVRLLAFLGIGPLAMACAGNPNELGGSPDVPMSQVGNVISLGSIGIGSSSYDIGLTGTVTKNEGGVVTVKVVADLSKAPTLSAFANLIPASAKDANGNVNTEIKLKMTTEGIQDYFNKDQKAHTAVKYGASVGDQYTLTKSDGVTITRKVVARSNQDDFPYGFFNIKTITVEQDSRIPGIKKFVYRANHKFGIVYVEMVPESGSPASAYLYSKY